MQKTIADFKDPRTAQYSYEGYRDALNLAFSYYLVGAFLEELDVPYIEKSVHPNLKLQRQRIQETLGVTAISDFEIDREKLELAFTAIQSAVRLNMNFLPDPNFHEQLNALLIQSVQIQLAYQQHQDVSQYALDLKKALEDHFDIISAMNQHRQSRPYGSVLATVFRFIDGQ